MSGSVRDRALVVVANRLPVEHLPDGQGWRTSPGGLVSALEPVVRASGGTWVGWAGSVGGSGSPSDDTPPAEADGLRLASVALSGDEVAQYYDGFANGTLWPLYHDAIVAPRFERSWWRAFCAVNQRFAEAAAEVAEPGATVWVQDYQLQLVPSYLRQARPDVRIGFFDHIPFPGFEIYARLPWRREIVEGLLGADLLGFQRRDDAGNFLRAARKLTSVKVKGAVVGPAGESHHATRVGVFPISVDARRWDSLACSPEVGERARRLRGQLGDPDVVLLGVDRLDYSKGIRHRLQAFNELLDEGALRLGRVVMVQVASPSRERVDEYTQLRDEVELVVGRINGDHSTLGTPVLHYLHQSFPAEEMAALYLAADVMLVTPLRDGMNLVAKEFVACRHDLRGVLILSEFTGAADQLARALIVNPYDLDALKAAIVEATDLAPKTAERRMRSLRASVFGSDVHRWAADFLEALGQAPGVS